MRHSDNFPIFVYRKTRDNQFIILYLPMKKEFGKWLMDVAKYMVTALLISSTFGDMKNPLIVACVVIASAVTLGAGLWLVKNTEKKED